MSRWRKTTYGNDDKEHGDGDGSGNDGSGDGSGDDGVDVPAAAKY